MCGARGAETTRVGAHRPAARARPPSCRARRAARRPRRPGPAALVLRDAPDRRHVRARRRVVDAPIAREADRPSGRARGRPGRCPGRSGMPKPPHGWPTCPSASARLMNASDVVHALRLLLGAARGEHHRACAPRRAGARRARVGLGHAGDALDALRPVGGDSAAHAARSLRCARAMKSSSTRPSRTSTCSRPLASAASVPGVSRRCSVAACAVGGAARIDDDQVRRRARAARRSTASAAASSRRGCCRPAGSTSARGDVLERERQPAIDAERLDCAAAAAEDMQKRPL